MFSKVDLKNVSADSREGTGILVGGSIGTRGMKAWAGHVDVRSSARASRLTSTFMHQQPPNEAPQVKSTPHPSHFTGSL